MSQSMKFKPFALTFLALCSVGALVTPKAAQAHAPGYTTVLDGLDNPRGMDFDSQGNLYVTESGSGGDGKDGRCIPSPSSQYIPLCAGANGSVIKLATDGAKTTILSGLDSIALSPFGEQAAGPADFKFDSQGNAYLLTGLAGNPTLRDTKLNAPTLGQLFKVDLGTGKLTSLADFGAYEAKYNPDGTDIISNPYAMAIKGETAYVVDGGGNDIYKVALDGSTGINGVKGIQDVKGIPQLLLPVTSLVYPPAPVNTASTAGTGAPGTGSAAPGAPVTGTASTGTAAPGGPTTGTAATGAPATGTADDKTGKPPAGAPPAGAPPELPNGYIVGPSGIPASQQSVPTGITVAPDGSLTLSEYSYYPYPEGKARIWSVDGNLTTTGTGPSNSQTTGKVLQDGFTQLTGVVYDKEGNLFALQHVNQSEWKAIEQGGKLIGDPSGSLIEIMKDGTRKTLLSGNGLQAASGLTLGPDGDIYISNNARFAGGKGSVIKFDPRAKVPESSSVLGLVAIGALGAGSMLKRKRKSLAKIQAELV